MRVVLIMPMLVLGVAGCSTASWYEGMRQHERLRCESLPESQRQACLDKNNDTWQDYDRKRRDTGTQQP